MASILKVDKIVDSGSNVLATSSGSGYAIDGGVNINTSLASATFPAGHILQVVDSKKTDTSVIQSSTYTDIGGTDNNGSGSVWCCKITPKSASSKIAVHCGIVYGKNNGNLSAIIRILRDGTLVMAADASGSRPQSWLGGYGQGSHWSNAAGISFLDSPGTTDEVTYKMQFRSEGGSYTTWINRFEGDYDSNTNGWRGASAILLMEVAG